RASPSGDERSRDDDERAESLAILCNIGILVMQDYQLWCTAHGMRLPPHLARMPRQLKGWDGQDDAHRTPLNSIWTRIARACLRQRVDPFLVLHIKAGQCSKPGYPPPPECLFVDGLDPAEVARLVKSGRERIIWNLRHFQECLPLEAKWREMSSGLDARKA